MTRFEIKSKTRLSVNGSVEGEPLEVKIGRKLSNKEGFDSDVELIYTEKKDGVGAGHNIKTDRFEVALEGLSQIDKQKAVKRDAKARLKKSKEEEIEAKKGAAEAKESVGSGDDGKVG